MRKLSKYYFKFISVESTIDEDVVLISNCRIDDEDWINPFAMKYDDEALLDVDPTAIEDDHHMQLSRYN